jgi:hypothetical protein
LKSVGLFPFFVLFALVREFGYSKEVERISGIIFAMTCVIVLLPMHQFLLVWYCKDGGWSECCANEMRVCWMIFVWKQWVVKILTGRVGYVPPIDKGCYAFIMA